ncbi:TetR family transcriptional regulator [Microbispora sp. KK1-11]|nr:TetR family transcriptional regulator [Microbispora sp. KK1-11]
MGARAAAVEVTRTRVMEASAALWRRRWYDDVTLQHVADEAGVSVQTIVNHFGGEARTPIGALARLRDRIVCGLAADYARDTLAELRARPADVLIAEHMLLGALTAGAAAGGSRGLAGDDPLSTHGSTTRPWTPRRSARPATSWSPRPPAHHCAAPRRGDDHARRPRDGRQIPGRRVPLVCVPLGRDQIEVARHVELAGAGITVSRNASPRTPVGRILASSIGHARRPAECVCPPSRRRTTLPVWISSRTRGRHCAGRSPNSLTRTSHSRPAVRGGSCGIWCVIW